MEKKYKIEKISKSKVVSLLENIESKKVQIVNMTPFDLYEDNLELVVDAYGIYVDNRPINNRKFYFFLDI